MSIRTGNSVQAIQTLEGYKAFRQERTASGGMRLASDAILRTGSTVNVDWLPLAAEQYLISADINDYVICDVPIVHVDIPNRNLDAFPYEEVSRFDVQQGRPVYQSFVGRPTHMDHDNKIPARAKGIIFDASLTKEAGTNRYVIRILAGFDRTKDRSLSEQILSGKRSGHSMGCMVNYTQCSIPGCEATSQTGKIRCAHHEGGIGKGRIINGHLTYEKCYSCTFIESSSVDDPADWSANQLKVK